MRIVAVAGPLATIRSGKGERVGRVGERGMRYLEQRTLMQERKQRREDRGAVKMDWWISRARGTKKIL